MTIVDSLSFHDWSGREREVNFLSSRVDSSRNFEVTVVTGQNGSYKSTLLRALVGALTVPGTADSLRLRGEPAFPHHIICSSGSVADRFPSKETPGGRSSEFDVPQYSYLGQRVGTNLLSKKRPLETLLTFALGLEKAHRFEWKFFEKAHRFAGILPDVEFEIGYKRSKEKLPKDILDSVQAKASLMPSPLRTGPMHGLPNTSPATAAWLLEEFHYDEFNELQQLLNSSGKKKQQLKWNARGAQCDSASNAAIRLGLLLDLWSLSDAKVRSSTNASRFSAYDLSSGEYHMYTSILGLGFGINETSVVLLDEPENSLHPQWQREFMETVYELCDATLRHGHLIVCTHSPLIVGTALESSTVVDLTGEAPVVDRAPYGASSDEVLLTQFGVGSSRNRIVVDTVQRAVSIVERGGFEHPDFLAMTDDLSSIRSTLRPDDPMVDILNALLDEGPAQ